jgi:hypothetical protein
MGANIILKKFSGVFVKFQGLIYIYNKTEGFICKKTRAWDFLKLNELILS